MKMAVSLLLNVDPCTVRCMGKLPCFPSIFTKGNNFSDFLSALLAEELLPKRGLLLKERICS